MKGDRVRFNVGGKSFETTATTLAAAGPDSFFGALLSNNWNTKATTDEVVFIDRNPDCFAVILDLLRTGELSIPPHVSEDSLIREAQFYGVVELVRAASWGSPLNGDFLLPSSSSITCSAIPSPFKMIFGNPNGGFCVANDTSVHVYDWMLHHHSAMEDRSTICVMSNDCSIGFLDLRFTGDIQWCSENVEGLYVKEIDVLQ